MLKIDFYSEKPCGVTFSFVVIAARYNGKWVLVRHKERNTYEIPGGHIEAGEDYTAAAKRELFEETGALDFTLDFVSIYTVTTDEKTGGGYLFFANIKEMSRLPEFEIAEVVLFDSLPDNLTYPSIQPHLHKRILEWMTSHKMEFKTTPENGLPEIKPMPVFCAVASVPEQNAPSKTREIFEQMASRYDTPERMKIAGIVAGEIRLKLKNSETKSKTALDYGCGTGLVGLELHDLFEKIVLADASPQMVEQTETKIRNRKIKNALTLCCDFAEALPENLQADFIILSQVLLHVKNYSQLLKKLHGLLNRGGNLIIVDFDKNKSIESNRVHNGFEQAELSSLLKEIGFSVVESATFYSGTKIFMNQDASLFFLNAAKIGGLIES